MACAAVDDAATGAGNPAPVALVTAHLAIDPTRHHQIAGSAYVAVLRLPLLSPEPETWSHLTDSPVESGLQAASANVGCT